ncbi:MAG: N-acetylmuramoyl-L-alanine amidase family protein [Candidatus Acidiferrales bacterium]
MLNRIRLAAILFAALAALGTSLNFASVSRAEPGARQSQAPQPAPGMTPKSQLQPFSPAGPQPSPQIVANPSPPLIVIDPAHGGPDPGAHSSSGINESDVVLEYARMMRIALEGEGLLVVLTREGNEDPSFDDRSAFANASRRAVFISLHVSTTGAPGTVRAYSLPIPLSPTPISVPISNLPPPVAVPNPHPGLRDWDHAQEPYLDQSRRLAELVQIQLSQRFRGSPDLPMAVAIRQLRTVAAPAIAVEVSSVSVPNRSQLDEMSSPLAQAVAKAVSDFLPLYAGASP